ncbi:MAG TPA: ureidoglycolate lyase [Crinalium sp.]|jgi:ureidoglycolate hydrolase
MSNYLRKSLQAQWITQETFRPYGQVIAATRDGKLYDSDDAQLNFGEGIPRFYIMRLHHRGQTFSRITRHIRCTQCLGALDGKEWTIAVAPPSGAAVPDVDAIAAFQIPGNCFIKLELGTWHAGPYFEQETVDFYNLELSDTNITDHDTCDLLKTYGLEFEIT